MRRFLIIGGAVVFTFSVKWFSDANDQRMRRDYKQKKKRDKAKNREENAQDVRFFARSLSDNVDWLVIWSLEIGVGISCLDRTKEEGNESIN